MDRFSYSPFLLSYSPGHFIITKLDRYPKLQIPLLHSTPTNHPPTPQKREHRIRRAINSPWYQCPSLFEPTSMGEAKNYIILHRPRPRPRPRQVHSTPNMNMIVCVCVFPEAVQKINAFPIELLSMIPFHGIRLLLAIATERCHVAIQLVGIWVVMNEKCLIVAVTFRAAHRKGVGRIWPSRST